MSDNSDDEVTLVQVVPGPPPKETEDVIEVWEDSRNNTTTGEQSALARLHAKRQKSQPKQPEHGPPLSEIKSYVKPDSHKSFTDGDVEGIDTVFNCEKCELTVGKWNLNRTDFMKLFPGAWLNDNIINAYLWLLTHNKQGIHCYNTNFLSHLVVEDKVVFEGVSTWHRNMNLFGSDYLFIPYNVTNNHWACFCVNFREKRIVHYDSMHNGFQGKEYGKHILRYLQELHLAESKSEQVVVENNQSEFNDKDWKIVPAEPTAPEQNNSYDCGVFVCLAIQYLVEGKAFDYEESHMNYFRCLMALSFFQEHVSKS